MAVSKAAQAATQRYKESHYDRLNLQLPKGEREMIAAVADKAGMSTNAYAIQAIREAIKADADKAGMSLEAYTEQAIRERMEHDSNA